MVAPELLPRLDWRIGLKEKEEMMRLQMKSLYYDNIEHLAIPAAAFSEVRDRDPAKSLR